MNTFQKILFILLFSIFPSVNGASCLNVEDCRVKAKQGDSHSQYKLGQMYFDGNGVPQDYTESILWFSKSAGQGYGHSYEKLGWIYSDGRVVPLDVDKSIRMFNLAELNNKELLPSSVRLRDMLIKISREKKEKECKKKSQCDHITKLKIKTYIQEMNELSLITASKLTMEKRDIYQQWCSLTRDKINKLLDKCRCNESHIKELKNKLYITCEVWEE